MINSFKDLIVWQKSYDLVKITYNLTKQMPQEERFSLTDQARRSSISIPSNIAEGYGRGSKKDYVRFLWMAYGSSTELETQLLLMKDLYNIDINTAYINLNETQKMLYAMIKKLNPEP